MNRSPRARGAGWGLGRSATAILSALLLVLCPACADDPVDPDPVTLQVMMAEDWADTDVVLDVVRRFEAVNPEVTISLIGRPFSQIPDELAASVAADRPLDVVHGHAFALGAQGLAEPVDDLWSSALDSSEYFPGAIEDVRWGDTFYGVPLDINAMIMILAPDAVDQAGVPTDFEDLRRMGSTIGSPGQPRLVFESNSWEVYGWIRANGGEVVEVEDDGTPRFTLDRPENIEALDLLGDLIADGLALGPTSRNVSDAYSLFQTGQVAVLTGGTWHTAALDSEPEPVEYRTATMPRGAPGSPGGSALGGSSLSVGRGSAHRDLALAFILALTDDEVARQMALSEGRLPPKRSLLAEAGLPADVAATVDAQLQSADPMKLIAFPVAQQAFASAIDSVLTGREDAATALARAQEAAEASVGS